MNGEPRMNRERVEVPDDVVWQGVDGQVIFLAGSHYYSLDPVGSQIWETLVECEEVATAEERLLAIFEVDRPTLHRDLVDLIAQLVSANLLRVTG